MNNASALRRWAVTMPMFLSTLILATALAVPTVTMTGCPLTATQTQNEINTILQEAAAIIAVADPGASWLEDFTKATNLLKADEAAWVKGGAVQDVINVLNDLEGVCALISPLLPYANLIGILVAGIDAVLALLLPAPTGQFAANAVKAGPPNPYKGWATVTSAKDSKTKWNAEAKKNPVLAPALLK